MVRDYITVWTASTTGKSQIDLALCTESSYKVAASFNPNGGAQCEGSSSLASC